MTGAAAMAPASVTMLALQDDPVAQKIHDSWPWYLTRASGLIAAVLLVILIVSGVGLLTGGTFRFLEPLVAWAAHRAMGIAFGVAVLIHVFSLLFDKFVGFTFADLLVPLITNYKPLTIAGHYLGSVYMALGTIAFYCVIAVVVTSLTLINKKPRPWKLVHFLSYMILALTFVHGLFLGTDLSGGIFRLVWVIGGVLLILPLIQRLRRAFTLGSRSGK
jgi:methionine sulfoxide reductase heme-binding subunit